MIKRTWYAILIFGITLHCTEEFNDPCANVICLNGGGCNNSGKCSCPTGYIGDDCGGTLEPEKVRVFKIQIIKFPSSKSSGNNWDENDGPDLYVTMGLVDGFSYLSVQDGKKDNVSIGSIVEWDINIAYYLEPVTNDFFLDLWDHDSGSHEFMGRCTFKPYDSTRGLPTELYLESSSGQLACKLFVSYSF